MYFYLQKIGCVSASLMQDKSNEIKASVLGYGGDQKYFKQRELKSKDDTGNFLNLPYFNCSNTTWRYAFLENGEAATLEAFLELQDIKQDDISTIEVKRPETPYSYFGHNYVELMVQNKVGEGGRNNALFIMVCMQNLNGQKTGKQN